MLVVTTEKVANHEVSKVLGQCFGLVVRSRGLGGNILAGIRILFGGEIIEYTEMLEEARRHALDRMVKNAKIMGANAVIMMRFDSSEMGQVMSEIVAYGTAVVLSPAPGKVLPGLPPSGSLAVSSQARTPLPLPAPPQNPTHPKDI